MYDIWSIFGIASFIVLIFLGIYKFIIYITDINSLFFRVSLHTGDIIKLCDRVKKLEQNLLKHKL